MAWNASKQKNRRMQRRGSRRDCQLLPHGEYSSYVQSSTGRAGRTRVCIVCAIIACAIIVHWLMNTYANDYCVLLCVYFQNAVRENAEDDSMMIAMVKQNDILIGDGPDNNPTTGVLPQVRNWHWTRTCCNTRIDHVAMHVCMLILTPIYCDWLVRILILL